MTTPSAAKGAKFERACRDYLAGVVPCERIPAGATLDRGDLWVPAEVTLQCKDHKRLSIGVAWHHTREQMTNNGHDFAFLIHKRHGVADPAAQWVTCDLAQLRSMLATGFEGIVGLGRVDL